MTKATPRARYTLEFKQEAVRLVDGGQTIAAAARALGVVDQTLFNWVKVHRRASSPALAAML
jgi:transposase